MGRTVENVTANVYINNKTAGKNMRSLRSETRKLKNEIYGLTPGTKAFVAKSKQLQKVEGQYRKLNQEIRGLSKSWGQAKQVMAGALGAFGVTQLLSGLKTLGTQIFNTRKKFETYNAVLTNALQSQDEATKSMAMLEKMAAKTPFSVDELTASYVKLVNRGFKPTEKEMIRMGDLAASVGKSFDQLTEAILDASTGEFERLKEFGIKASKQGDIIKFTFKGITTEVRNSDTAIQDYVLSLGELTGVQGSMAAIAATSQGAVSNLGDTMDSLYNTIGKRLNPAVSGFISGFSGLIQKFQKWIAIDPSEEIEKERVSMKMLELQIYDTNTPSEKRIELIKELQKKYPTLLGNLDAEKVKNEELKTALAKVNEMLITKVALAAQEAQLRETTDLNVSLMTKRLNTENALREKLVKTSEKHGIKLKEGYNIQNQAFFLAKEINDQRENGLGHHMDAEKLKGDVWAIKRLKEQELKAQEKLNEELKIQGQIQQELLEKYGVSSESIVNTNEDDEPDGTLGAQRETEKLLDIARKSANVGLEAAQDEQLKIMKASYTDQLNAAKIFTQEHITLMDRMNSEEARTTMQYAANAFGDLANAMEQGSEAQKAFAIAQASINTYLGASQVISDPTLPTVAKAFAVAGIIAQGLTQVKRIKDTPVPTYERGKGSYYTGGYTGFGFGTPDSSGHKVAGVVHEEEYVIPKWMMQQTQVANVAGMLEDIRTGKAQNGNIAGSITENYTTNTTKIDQTEVVNLLKIIAANSQKPALAVVSKRTVRDITEQQEKNTSIINQSKIN